jgi:hypothetical protein
MKREVLKKKKKKKKKLSHTLPQDVLQESEGNKNNL